MLPLRALQFALKRDERRVGAFVVFSVNHRPTFVKRIFELVNAARKVIVVHRNKYVLRFHHTLPMIVIFSAMFNKIFMKIVL